VYYMRRPPPPPTVEDLRREMERVREKLETERLTSAEIGRLMYRLSNIYTQLNQLGVMQATEAHKRLHAELVELLRELEARRSKVEAAFFQALKEELDRERRESEELQNRIQEETREQVQAQADEHDEAQLDAMKRANEVVDYLELPEDQFRDYLLEQIEKNEDVGKLVMEWAEWLARQSVETNKRLLDEAEEYLGSRYGEWLNQSEKALQDLRDYYTYIISLEQARAEGDLDRVRGLTEWASKIHLDEVRGLWDALKRDLESFVKHEFEITEEEYEEIEKKLKRILGENNELVFEIMTMINNSGRLANIEMIEALDGFFHPSAGEMATSMMEMKEAWKKVQEEMMKERISYLSGEGETKEAGGE